jgi:hypothetical protein
MGTTTEERLREILDELCSIGAVLPGSISARTTRCQRPGCHCRVEPFVLHGPYSTWTWRRGGAAVTKTLTTDEAERLRSYSAAHHRLKQLVTELELVSLDLIEEREGTDFGRARSLGHSRPEAGG